MVGSVNLPLLNRLSGNGSVSLEDHHDESHQAQRRADKWMIVGAALMGMWAPGLIGFPIFMRGVWLQRQALRAGLSVRPMIVTLIGYLVLIDGMLNSLGWALDLVANHTLINRVLMVGFMNEEALALTKQTGFATFFSRTRNKLWMKGETSGNRLAVRQIFVDGRKHPDDPDPTWYGHSVGHYEGQTLVVDTVGFNDKFWFDFRGQDRKSVV